MMLEEWNFIQHFNSSVSLVIIIIIPDDKHQMLMKRGINNFGIRSSTVISSRGTVR